MMNAHNGLGQPYSFSGRSNRGSRNYEQFPYRRPAERNNMPDRSASPYGRSGQGCGCGLGNRMTLNNEQMRSGYASSRSDMNSKHQSTPYGNSRPASAQSSVCNTNGNGYQNGCGCGSNNGDSNSNRSGNRNGNRNGCGCESNSGNRSSNRNSNRNSCGCGDSQGNSRDRSCGCGCSRNCGQDNGYNSTDNTARMRLMEQIRAVDFALYETILYLDVYPHSCDALETYHKLKAQREALHKEYQSAHGPITAFGNESTATWDWIDQPFPWEYASCTE